MMESFTAGAERALMRAERVARRRGAELVEPLDLLAALTLESESRAVELMTEFGVQTNRLWSVFGPDVSEILSGIEPVEPEPLSGLKQKESIPQSSDLRLVLGEAIAQAREFDRRREVGTEHLLAGLASASDEAANLLRFAGLDFQPLFDRLAEVAVVESAPIPMAEEIPPLDLDEADGVNLARILDASANRAHEGLRVVEDYTRFALDDPGLTRRLKEIRHRLAEAERGLDGYLLIDARDTREDVGTHIMTRSERVRENPARSWPRTSNASKRPCDRWKSTASWSTSGWPVDSRSCVTTCTPSRS